MRHNEREVRQFACQVAMRLAEQGFAVWWADLHDEATQSDGTTFRVEDDLHRAWFSVTDGMVLMHRHQEGLIERVVSEITRKLHPEEERLAR